MTQEVTIEYDHSVIGQEVGGKPFKVTKEHLLQYCRVISETNPLFTDEEAAAKGPFGSLVAAPGYVAGIPSPRPPDPKVKFHGFGMHGGQRTQYLEPIRPGDVITPSSSIEQVYSKTGRSGTMVFVVSLTTYRNQHGRPAVIVRSNSIQREKPE